MWIWGMEHPWLAFFLLLIAILCVRDVLVAIFTR